MKIEIVHDLLAKSVFDFASAEDKARAKAEAIIKNRFGYYQSDNTLLLGEGELNYIQPFLNELMLTEKELSFVEHSKKVLARQHNLLRNRNYIIAIMALLMILMPFGVIGWYSAYTESHKAKTATEEKAKTQDSLQFAKNEVNVLRKVVTGEEVVEDELSQVIEPRDIGGQLIKDIKPAFTTIRIWGEVKSNRGLPVYEASVEVLGTHVKTNRTGAFDVYVVVPPYYMQKDTLALKIDAKGYETYIYQFKPQPEIKQNFELKAQKAKFDKNIKVQNIKIK